MSICHVSQGRFWISDNYVQKSGFLPLADTNDIVMMFPQVKLIIISIKINNLTEDPALLGLAVESGRVLGLLGLPRGDGG